MVSACTLFGTDLCRRSVQADEGKHKKGQSVCCGIFVSDADQSLSFSVPAAMVSGYLTVFAGIFCDRL